MLIECRPEQRQVILFFEEAVVVLRATEQIEGFARLSRDAKIACAMFAGDALNYVFNPTDYNKAEVLCSVQQIKGKSFEISAMKIAAVAISEVQARVNDSKRSAK